MTDPIRFELPSGVSGAGLFREAGAAASTLGRASPDGRWQNCACNPQGMTARPTGKLRRRRKICELKHRGGRYFLKRNVLMAGAAMSLLKYKRHGFVLFIRITCRCRVCRELNFPYGRLLLYQKIQPCKADAHTEHAEEYQDEMEGKR